MSGPLLKVSGLTKSYRLGDDRISVLSGISLAVARGEMVAIMGPSGSGKSTLLNCISGIDIPDDAAVQLAGKPVDYASERQRTLLRRRHVGMIFQFFNLVPSLTVEENVALPLLISGVGRPDRKERIGRLLEEVGMQGRRSHLPFQLSGGEMQLVSIARALVHAPDLVLADEPTGNVNPGVGRSIMRTLRETGKREDAGILMVTHNPEHAAWADRICFLKNGTIADELAQGGNAAHPAAVHARLLELGI